ncbi:cytochrome C [Leptobacterium flavescens]|uniref:Cytochrome C n=1 Tax=Leptobacterium flavescens TaxID=472055 RepID=A0A6P0UK21_9FLAO|nr:nitrate reductase cytochrome c-type subunit [Leptobacterium flavescens]NER13655.1 cytochrome C [Leptobacterium flavescens]
MKRLTIILLFSLLMLAFIIIWGYSYRTSREEAYIPIEKNEVVIPSEAGVFERSEFAAEYANIPVDENHFRTLETYYDNRAYHGAPPSIPHPVESEISMGGKVCLKCHQNGGFVEKYSAYAPVTPHPDMINCRQCHVAENASNLFKETNWEKKDAPAVGVNNAMEGSPPVIPHQLQLRENCLSCHAGPSAPVEIRVTHPERINCRQCHVLNDKEIQDIGHFIRKNNEQQ